MAQQRKTWREKLRDDKGLPQVKPIDGKMAKRWGEGTLVIPAPREVDAVMRRVREGRLITINLIRARLAAKHGATIACPICTGMFAVFAARAADEDWQAGSRRVTPYWRTLKAGGELNEKYPGGIEYQALLLTAEGHHVVKEGRRHFVLDYERKLVRR
jgi:hypothetical protein